MVDQITLSDSEREFLEPILRHFTEIGRKRFPVTLEYLIGRWERFVGEVEDGYQLTMYDYWNDLYPRAMLDEIVAVAPRELKEKLEKVLPPLDARLKNATLDAGRLLFPRADHPRKEWWWFRIPKEPGPELRKDLEAEGFI